MPMRGKTLSHSGVSPDLTTKSVNEDILQTDPNWNSCQYEAVLLSTGGKLLYNRLRES